MGIGKWRTPAKKVQKFILEESVKPDVRTKPYPHIMKKYEHVINDANFSDFPVTNFQRPKEKAAAIKARKAMIKKKVTKI